MSNGVKICCLAGVCCPPEERLAEMAKFLHNAKVEVGSVPYNSNGQIESPQYEKCSLDYKAQMEMESKYLLSKMDIAPKGFVEQLVNYFAPWFGIIKQKIEEGLQSMKQSEEDELLLMKKSLENDEVLGERFPLDEPEKIE